MKYKVEDVEKYLNSLPAIKFRGPFHIIKKGTVLSFSTEQKILDILTMSEHFETEFVESGEFVCGVKRYRTITDIYRLLHHYKGTREITLSVLYSHLSYLLVKGVILSYICGDINKRVYRINYGKGIYLGNKFFHDEYGQYLDLSIRCKYAGKDMSDSNYQGKAPAEIIDIGRFNSLNHISKKEKLSRYKSLKLRRKFANPYRVSNPGRMYRDRMFNINL